MLRLLRVVVTGSIASGKSTVCRFFKQWGAYVVDADRLLHEAFLNDEFLKKQIFSLFGEDVIGPSIDRTKVAKIVFSHPELLRRMEDICHPYVNEAIKKLYDRAYQQKEYLFFVAEVPLLFESRDSLFDWFDVVVVVVTEREFAKKRYQEKGGMLEQFLVRERRQMPPQDKEKHATYSIFNNGSIEELELRSQELFKEILNLSKTNFRKP